jgi:dolichol-phosphate mannosyltransferase
MKDTLVSVVLPVYNQADHISDIVHEYEAALSKMQNPHELLLVTNGCRDKSPEICQALAGQYPSVRALDSEERGWGAAIKLGFNVAQGDLLCYTNSARTSPQDLMLMLFYALAYPDVVVKVNRKIRENWQRRIGSLLYNIECRTLFDLSNWDVNGTPKVFPRKFDKLLTLTDDGILIDAEFCAVCRREDYPMIEVPIFSIRRHGGKSTTNYGTAAHLYWGVCRLWWKMRGGGK